METPTCKKLTQTERVICGRCAGDGKYPSAVYNGVCFGCKGRGFKFTKRGAAAEAYLLGLRSKLVEDLKVGDTIRASFGMFGGITAFATITKLEPITPENASCFSIQPDGSRTHDVGYQLTLDGGGHGLLVLQAQPGSSHRVAQTAEQKASTLALALAYQETLTKTGTVKKSLQSPAAAA